MAHPNMARRVQNPFAAGRGGPANSPRRVNYSDYRYNQNHRHRRGLCSPSILALGVVLILFAVVYALFPASQLSYYSFESANSAIANVHEKHATPAAAPVPSKPVALPVKSYHNTFENGGNTQFVNNGGTDRYGSGDQNPDGYQGEEEGRMDGFENRHQNPALEEEEEEEPLPPSATEGDYDDRVPSGKEDGPDSQKESLDSKTAAPPTSAPTGKTIQDAGIPLVPQVENKTKQFQVNTTLNAIMNSSRTHVTNATALETLDAAVNTSATQVVFGPLPENQTNVSQTTANETAAVSDTFKALNATTGNSSISYVNTTETNATGGVEHANTTASYVNETVVINAQPMNGTVINVTLHKNDTFMGPMINASNVVNAAVPEKIWNETAKAAVGPMVNASDVVNTTVPEQIRNETAVVAVMGANATNHNDLSRNQTEVPVHQSLINSTALSTGNLTNTTAATGTSKNKTVAEIRDEVSVVEIKGKKRKKKNQKLFANATSVNSTFAENAPNVTLAGPDNVLSNATSALVNATAVTTTSTKSNTTNTTFINPTVMKPSTNTKTTNNSKSNNIGKSLNATFPAASESSRLRAPKGNQTWTNNKNKKGRKGNLRGKPSNATKTQ